MDHFPDEEEEKRMDSASDASSLAAISKRGPGLHRGAATVGGPPPSSWFEIRLFYVRVSPCAADAAPPHLTLAHLRREIGVALEINGARVPAAEPTSVALRRDRVDRATAEVTYVSTDSVRLTGAVDFEVRHGDDLLLCGTLERMEMPWSNGVLHHNPGPLATPQSSVKDPKTGWSMHCYSAASLASLAFVQPKLGIVSPSIEVYVAGCCSGFPLILTQTVHHSPRRKPPRQGVLDVIPEDEETGGKEQGSSEAGLIRHRSSSLAAGGRSSIADFWQQLWQSTEEKRGRWQEAAQVLGGGCTVALAPPLRSLTRRSVVKGSSLWWSKEKRTKGGKLQGFARVYRWSLETGLPDGSYFQQFLHNAV